MPLWIQHLYNQTQINLENLQTLKVKDLNKDSMKLMS